MRAGTIAVARRCPTQTKIMTAKAMPQEQHEQTRRWDHPAEHPAVRRPFDTRELEDFPLPDERDPPYRPWWVEDYKPISDQ
jgi:hypothetical protein